MREIKFRAWDNESNTMLDSDDCLPISLGSLNSGDYLVPMQYTGLKDKNGVGIYEGDILKFVFGYEEQVQAVKWQEDYVAFGVEGIMLNQFNYKLDRDGYIPCEVIGNVWENEELLA
jgi:uncharacterized phage protein (TIGR01671 family)